MATLAELADHVEAALEPRRDPLFGFGDKAMSPVRYAASGQERAANQQPLLAYVEAKIENPQAQLVMLNAKADEAERRCAEATARVDALEMQLARGSSEIAQIRLIHAGMWDSWQAATAELERATEKCRMFEQEISDLRRRAAELNTALNALYASTSWRVTAPVRWLRRALSRRQ